MCGVVQIPSFAHDAVVEGKGVVFGHKLPVWEDIAEKLGYPRPPAPGGNCKVRGTSLVELNGCGGVVGARTHVAECWSVGQVPSFAEDNKLHNKVCAWGVPAPASL